MKIFDSKLKIFCLIVFCILIWGNGARIFAAQDDAAQQDLKMKINTLRNQINEYQKDIDSKSRLEKNLQGDIGVLEKEIAKIELRIQETQLVIQSLDLEISNKEIEIDKMQKEVDAKKKILSQFLQELYERGQASSVEMALGEETFSDCFFQADNLESFQERTKDIHDRFVDLQEGLERERRELVLRKEEQMDMRAIQNDQQNTLDAQKKSKDVLLGKTKNEKQDLSSQMEKLQTQLNALQSLGEPISIDEAVSAAKYAAKLTDVAPEFLLGMLRVESGLGTNVGGGRYKTDMNPAQWETFKKICRKLELDPDKIPVSRRICYNSNSKNGCGGWGGAMGPAQFMPSTWTGYGSRVEKLTNVEPANPWDLKDSLVAMGLKLAAVDGVTDGKRDAWAKAAAMYLAGGAWENYSWYSDKVLAYADGFKKIIK